MLSTSRSPTTTRPHRSEAFTEGGFRTGDADLFETLVEGPYKGKTELQRERPETVGKAVALRNDEYTYVYRLYEDDELYDRRLDPGETTNLLAQAGHEETAARLRERVLAWLLETSDVIPWEKDPRIPKIPQGRRD